MDALESLLRGGVHARNAAFDALSARLDDTSSGCTLNADALCVGLAAYAAAQAEGAARRGGALRLLGGAAPRMACASAAARVVANVLPIFDAEGSLAAILAIPARLLPTDQARGMLKAAIAANSHPTAVALAGARLLHVCIALFGDDTSAIAEALAAAAPCLLSRASGARDPRVLSAVAEAVAECMYTLNDCRRSVVISAVSDHVRLFLDDLDWTTASPCLLEAAFLLILAADLTANYAQCITDAVLYTRRLKLLQPGMDIYKAPPSAWFALLPLLLSHCPFNLMCIELQVFALYACAHYSPRLFYALWRSAPDIDRLSPPLQHWLLAAHAAARCDALVTWVTAPGRTTGQHYLLAILRDAARADEQPSCTLQPTSLLSKLTALRYLTPISFERSLDLHDLYARLALCDIVNVYNADYNAELLWRTFHFLHGQTLWSDMALRAYGASLAAILAGCQPGQRRCTVSWLARSIQWIVRILAVHHHADTRGREYLTMATNFARALFACYSDQSVSSLNDDDADIYVQATAPLAMFQGQVSSDTFKNASVSTLSCIFTSVTPLLRTSQDYYMLGVQCLIGGLLEHCHRHMAVATLAQIYAVIAPLPDKDAELSNVVDDCRSFISERLQAVHKTCHSDFVFGMNECLLTGSHGKENASQKSKINHDGHVLHNDKQSCNAATLCDEEGLAMLPYIDTALAPSYLQWLLASKSQYWPEVLHLLHKRGTEFKKLAIQPFESIPLPPLLQQHHALDVLRQFNLEHCFLDRTSHATVLQTALQLKCRIPAPTDAPIDHDAALAAFIRLRSNFDDDEKAFVLLCCRTLDIPCDIVQFKDPSAVAIFATLHNSIPEFANQPDDCLRMFWSIALADHRMKMKATRTNNDVSTAIMKSQRLPPTTPLRQIVDGQHTFKLSSFADAQVVYSIVRAVIYGQSLPSCSIQDRIEAAAWLVFKRYSIEDACKAVQLPMSGGICTIVGCILHAVASKSAFMTARLSHVRLEWPVGAALCRDFGAVCDNVEQASETQDLSAFVYYQVASALSLRPCVKTAYHVCSLAAEDSNAPPCFTIHANVRIESYTVDISDAPYLIRRCYGMLDASLRPSKVLGALFLHSESLKNGAWRIVAEALLLQPDMLLNIDWTEHVWDVAEAARFCHTLRVVPKLNISRRHIEIMMDSIDQSGHASLAIFMLEQYAQSANCDAMANAYAAMGWQDHAMYLSVLSGVPIKHCTNASIDAPSSARVRSSLLAMQDWSAMDTAAQFNPYDSRDAMYLRLRRGESLAPNKDIVEQVATAARLNLPLIATLLGSKRETRLPETHDQIQMLLNVFKDRCDDRSNIVALSSYIRCDAIIHQSAPGSAQRAAAFHVLLQLSKSNDNSLNDALGSSILRLAAKEAIRARLLPASTLELDLIVPLYTHALKSDAPQPVAAVATQTANLAIVDSTSNALRRAAKNMRLVASFYDSCYEETRTPRHATCAIDAYVQSLCTDATHRDASAAVHRLLALMSDVGSDAPSLPVHLWLPVVPQLMAHLGKAPFWSNILRTVAHAHPHAVIYHLLFAASDEGVEDAAQAPKRGRRELVHERVAARGATAKCHKDCRDAANKILDSLTSTHAGIVRDSISLREAYMELAALPVPENVDPRTGIVEVSRQLRISALSSLENACIPAVRGHVAFSGLLHGGYRVIGGLRMPKVVEVRGSDGQAHRQLVKSGDDLRLDALCIQVFGLVNTLIGRASAEAPKLEEYAVAPLSRSAGVIEWVRGATPLGDWLARAHAGTRPGDLPPAEARALARAEAERPGSTPASRYALYAQRIVPRFQPVLGRLFVEAAPSADEWLRRRAAFAASAASASAVGHVLGLGDRHCQNILVNRRTGALVLIDLNMLFDAGRRLRVPEVVPFRLTRDMLDGIGGDLALRVVFLPHVVRVLEALRGRRSDVVQLVRAVFGSAACGAAELARLSERLGGVERYAVVEPSSGDSSAEQIEVLAPTAQAALLVQLATDPRRLSQMYHGWQPWM